MKTLIIVLLCLIALCGIFYLVDGPGNGLALWAEIFVGILVVALLVNRFHNGTWFTDNSGGK